MTHIAKTLDVAVEDKITSRDVPDAIRVPVASAHKLHWRPVLLAGVAIIGLAAAGQFGWNYWTVGRFHESTDDAYVQADTTVIAPKVSGYLREVLVTDNQPVKAGQPLARIDDRDYAIALGQAKADVTAAQADVANVEASLAEQQAVIAQSRATVEVDRASVTFTQQDNDRYRTLARTGAGSVQNEQQAEAKLQIARSTLQRDTAAVTAAERRMEMLRAQLAKAQTAPCRIRQY